MFKYQILGLLILAVGSGCAGASRPERDASMVGLRAEAMACDLATLGEAVAGLPTTLGSYQLPGHPDDSKPQYAYPTVYDYPTERLRGWVASVQAKWEAVQTDCARLPEATLSDVQAKRDCYGRGLERTQWDDGNFEITRADGCGGDCWERQRYALGVSEADVVGACAAPTLHRLDAALPALEAHAQADRAQAEARRVAALAAEEAAPQTRIARYCDSQAQLRFLRHQLADERSAGRISGYVNATRLNQLGHSILLLKRRVDDQRSRLPPGFRAEQCPAR